MIVMTYKNLCFADNSGFWMSWNEFFQKVYLLTYLLDLKHHLHVNERPNHIDKSEGGWMFAL